MLERLTGWPWSASATYLAFLITFLAAAYCYAGNCILMARLKDAKDQIERLEARLAYEQSMRSARANSEAKALIKVLALDKENERLKAALLGNLYSTIQVRKFERN